MKASEGGGRRQAGCQRGNSRSCTALTPTRLAGVLQRSSRDHARSRACHLLPLHRPTAHRKPPTQAPEFSRQLTTRVGQAGESKQVATANTGDRSKTQGFQVRRAAPGGDRALNHLEPTGKPWQCLNSVCSRTCLGRQAFSPDGLAVGNNLHDSGHFSPAGF